MRVFLDANVLFTAAHNPAGKAALVIELGKSGLWRLASSAYAAEEARRNIALKFPGALAVLESLLDAMVMVADAVEVACPDRLPDKDRPIFRAAAGCRADFLLTGDLKDFGFMMNDPSSAGGMMVQTVADFLAGQGASQR